MTQVEITATRTLDGGTTESGGVYTFPPGVDATAFNVFWENPTGAYVSPIQLEWECSSGTGAMAVYAFEGTYASGDPYHEDYWTATAGASGVRTIPDSWLTALNDGTLTIQVQRFGDSDGTAVQFSRLLPTAGSGVAVAVAAPFRLFPRRDNRALGSARTLRGNPARIHPRQQ